MYILCNILKYHLNANYSRKRNFPLKESLDAIQLLQNIQWDIQFSEKSQEIFPNWIRETLEKSEL